MVRTEDDRLSDAVEEWQPRSALSCTNSPAPDDIMNGSTAIDAKLDGRADGRYMYNLYIIVRAFVRVCVCACVRACVSQRSTKLLYLTIIVLLYHWLGYVYGNLTDSRS